MAKINEASGCGSDEGDGYGRGFSDGLGDGCGSDEGDGMGRAYGCGSDEGDGYGEG